MLVELLSERAQLEAQLSELRAKHRVTSEKSSVELFLEGLLTEGFAIDAKRESKIISRIGLDRWKLAVQPHLGRAPIEGQPTAFSAHAPVARMSDDQDLKKYDEATEDSRERALEAAAEWDENAQQGYELTSAGRSAYIDFRVTRDTSEA